MDGVSSACALSISLAELADHSLNSTEQRGFHGSYKGNKGENVRMCLLCVAVPYAVFTMTLMPLFATDGLCAYSDLQQSVRSCLITSLLS